MERVTSSCYTADHMEYDASRHPKRLVVVRHGESEANVFQEFIDRGEPVGFSVEYSKVNDAEVALTPRGREQALRVGAYLKQRFGDFDYSFVSPFRRTRETFEKIIEAYGTDPETRSRFMSNMRYDTRLREKDFGGISFMTKEEIQTLFPFEATRLEREGKYLYRPLGGESWYDVKDNRANSVLQTMYRILAGKTVLVVTHTVVMKCIALKFGHIEVPEEIERFDTEHSIDPCGIAVFDYAPDRGITDRLSLVEWNTTAPR